MVVELDARERAVLSTFRERETPSDEVAERSWVELQERIVEAPRIDPDAGVPLADARVVDWVHLGKAAALSVGLAAATLAAIYLGSLGYRAWVVEDEGGRMEAADRAVVGTAGGTAQPRESKSTMRHGVDEASQVVEDLPSASIAMESMGTGSVGDPARASPSPRNKKRAKTEPSASELAAELDLLARAKRARDAGERLALLTEHAQRFPRSKFSDERRVLEAEALCALGKKAEARARVEAFLRDRPRSAYGARMRQVCTDAKK